MHAPSTPRKFLRRLAASLLTLLIIAYLTLFGLLLAERGRERLPARPLNAAAEAASSTFAYLTHHPQVYYWDTYQFPAFRLVAATFGRSAGLLLVSLGAATALGAPLGVAAALTRRRLGKSLMLLLSVLGVSTPSFLLAMLLWMVNIQIHRRLGVPALPPTGFGWDLHLVMPALVLAARPLAQIAQITYVSLSEVLGEEYIRTARAKGLPWRVVYNRHALRNVLIPILTTLGTSLRFSLASLPVVEYFFLWPGVGLMLLETIEQGMTYLTTDLIASLGLFFLLMNAAIEVIYPLLDPRLRGDSQSEGIQRERRSWRELISEWWADMRQWICSIRSRKQEARGRRRQARGRRQEAGSRRRWSLHGVRDNPALIVGGVLAFILLGLAIFGGRWTQANPYQIHGVMVIEGQIASPPFAPSSTFRWGSDHIGRDVQALVLTGARQTLILALLGMGARLLVGALLGALAGWWQGSWFDRLVTGAVGVWAAFPYTLFAMIVIQALGIQQGMSVFVIALCVVGWGEVAQFVRGQTLGIRPQLYIEAARAVGARSAQLLIRHVLPNLLAALVALAMLEMGGVLMLLSELGFLNIFLGGGYRVEIGEVGAMTPVIAYFSDVPEWGALLANIRDWWRSYPWMAWYPGLAFFLSMVTFNLWGEGLRRFLTEGRVNLSRLLNRYTAMAALIAAIGVGWGMRSASPLGVYSAPARQFDAQRALADIRILASPEFAGRESGAPGMLAAADYITARMQEIGLSPGGPGNSYTLAVSRSVAYLLEKPILEILDEQGNVREQLTYGRDFAAYGGPFMVHGEAVGAIVGLTTGPMPETPASATITEDCLAFVCPGQYRPGNDPYGLRNLELYDKVLLINEAELYRINIRAARGALVVTDSPLRLQRKQLIGFSYTDTPPIFYITPDVAERLLATAGGDLAELEQRRDALSPGAVALTAPGVSVHLQMFVGERTGDYPTVIGFIPGAGAQMGAAPGTSLARQAIIVSAYYDGVGTGFDGELYPGANDNASGVAAMLEIARVLKESPYPPKRTVVFIAWPGGERYESLSVSDAMNGVAALRQLTVEAVIELSGMGAGNGKAVALEEGSSYRLVQLFQRAAERMDAAVTTRGRDPHYGLWARPGFGGRSALSAYVSWDGSDRTAHTVEDTVAAIDPAKLERSGQTTLLALFMLSRELEY